MLTPRFAALASWLLLALALAESCGSGSEQTGAPYDMRRAGAGGAPVIAPPDPIGFAGEAGAGGAAAFDPDLWDECRTICRREARHHCPFDVPPMGAAGAGDPDVPLLQPNCVADWCRSDEVDQGGTCPREWAAVIHCLANLPLSGLTCTARSWDWVGCQTEFGVYDRCTQPFP